ncbi:GPP34 family phosphoprotein [Streptomyces sp. NPDC001393]
MTAPGKPEDQTAALIALLHHAGLHTVALPTADATAVEARMADIAEGQGPADKLGEAVQSALRALVVLTASSVPGMFT